MTRAATGPSRKDLVVSVLCEHAGEFRSLVAARLPSADVDDALQTAAVRAVERAESLTAPERVLPWLYRVHRNVIADTLRSRASRERVLAGIDAAPEAHVPAPACGCSLAQAKRLQPSYASVLGLVDSGDATIAEAAAHLGISVNNLSVRLHRARRALRKAMLEHCGVASLRDCLNCRCVEDGCCEA